ncbi:MAG: putative manganese transporter [Bacteroidota bacterium]
MESFPPKILNVGIETLKITVLVFLMMVIVDLLNIWTKGKLSSFLRNGPRIKQYITASSLGALPGCFGAFTGVSLYVHGLISLGALTGAMAAASGDEAFVMLALFPKTAMILIIILFLLGILVGWIVDKIIKKVNFKPCLDCQEQILHPKEKGFRHFMKEHILNHILRKHLWKTAIWTLGALLFIEFGVQYLHLNSFSTQYPLLLLLIAALMGLIPESGPHMIFISLYASNMVPFSVLFTSAFVQDGHGMLPMLSYSVKDSVLIKVINLGIGTSLGLLLFIMGY